MKNWQDPISYPQIPVRAYIKGVQADFTGALSKVEHYYDYIDFRISIDDPTVFEVKYSARFFPTSAVLTHLISMCFKLYGEAHKPKRKEAR